MKITSVDVIKVVVEPQSPFPWNPVVIRINTDDGLSGFGEVGLAYGVGASAGFGMVKDLAGMVIGMDPMRVEEIWNKMQKKTFWGQGGGTVVSAGMSAIDIALWDIRGKALNTPVYQLLGGKTNTRLRAYASQLQYGWAKDRKKLLSPKEYAEVARVAIEDGYDAVKVDPLVLDREGGWYLINPTGLLSQDTVRMGVERIAAMRDAGGPDLDIICELHSNTDTNTAIQFGRAIQDMKIFYYEEPVMPLNPKQMKAVADHVKIPLASGERIYTRWGYRPFFENGSLAVIQPDMCTAGGFTEIKKICDMAHVYDVTVQIHVCGGPISTAASLHMEAAIPNFIIHEVHRHSRMDMNINTCKYDYQPQNGYYSIPDLPGIGQELTKEAIQKSDIVTVK